SDDGMQRVIQAQLGEHRWYVELFAGGCRTLLGKAPSQIEWVNDLHPALINLLHLLASAEGRRLEVRLKRTMFCESVYAEAKATYEELSTDDPPFWNGTSQQI